MKSGTYRVLIADDERPIRKIIERICAELGWSMDQTACGNEALDYLDKTSHQIYIVDVRMPGPSGLELAQKILDRNPFAAIIILTGYAELDQAVQSLKQGVFDYVQKDSIDTEEIKTLLQKAAQFYENRKYTNQRTKEREKIFHDIDTANKQFQAILELSSDLIFILKADDGQIVDCNAAVSEKLQYARSVLFKKNWQNICSKMTSTNLERLILEIRSKGSLVVESSLAKKNGDTIPVEISYAYVSLDTGNFTAAIARDVTERKHHEAIHQDYLKQLESVLISTIESIALTVEKRDPYTAGHQKKSFTFSSPNWSIDRIVR